MRLSRCLATGAAACALLVVAACSTAPTRSSVPAPADWTPETEQDPLAEATSPAEPSAQEVPADETPASETPASETPAGDAPADGSAVERGLIAAAGPNGLRLMSPSGYILDELAASLIVTQPTWSRDGLRLAATLTDPTSGAYRVAVVDIVAGEVVTAPARRPYFFYSWNHGGTRLAALGPGSMGGTALDILDHVGAPTSESSLQRGSIYLAWEPDGRRLLVHAGPELLLVSDPDSLDDYDELGPVGFAFLAAAWVPGTEDFLYVDAYQQPLGNGSSEAPSNGAGSDAIPRLVRRSLDRGEVADLGPVVGLAGLAVHPAGERVALSFATVESAEPADPPDSTGTVETASASQSADLVAGSQSQAENWSGSVQILDLATTESFTILDRTGHWLEWSPDGLRLLMVSVAQQDANGASLVWHVWDGDQSVELARFAPSVAFLSNYLRFADQYTETPRLWSPDSDAITFGANTAEGDVALVARLDGSGAMTSLGPSDVSFWSPIPTHSPNRSPDSHDSTPGPAELGRRRIHPVLVSGYPETYAQCTQPPSRGSQRT